MAEKECKVDQTHKYCQRRSRIASLLSVLSFLTTASCLAFLIWFHTQESQTIADQDYVIDRIVERAQRLDNDVNEAKTLLQNILKKLPESGNGFETLTRHKRDEFSDNDQAEEDLSELSLTALSFLRGPPGFPGRDGRDGAQGPRGVSGTKGEQGTPGLVGPKGAQGSPGLSGLNGRDGLQGPVGPRGDSGERGPAGNAGPPGPPGATGAKGDQGERGASGPRGERGPAGAAGGVGAPGTSGAVESGGANVTQFNISQTQLVADVEMLTESVVKLETIHAAGGARSLKCPGWTREASMSQTLIGDTCYVLVNQQKSWTDAHDFCQGHSYNLVSFDSRSKQAIVENWMINILNRQSSQEFWTAGYRVSGTPITAWLWRHDDQDVPFGDYSDWASGEPDSYDYCVADKYTNWYGKSCSYRYNFVCEGPPAIESVDPQQSGGSVYTHWGRTSCSNTSLTLYSGLVGGAKYDSVGGGVNFQCLPPNPDLNDYNIHATAVSWMRSVEYESQTYGLFADQVDNTHAVCSRCYTRNRPAVFMIPGKTTCPEDWVKEYSGFLMAGKEDESHPTTYECVDKTPQYQGLSPADLGGRFWFVNVDCQSGGSLGQCNLYRHGRQMSCVVCTK